MAYNENMSNPEKPRNVNAEYAILKEKAAVGGKLSWKANFARDPEEREKYRRRGEMLLRVINRMPDKLDTEEKSAKLERIHRLAQGVGLGEDLKEAIESGMDGAKRSAKVGGETSAGGEARLTPEEEQRAEVLRERVIEMTELEDGVLAGEFPSATFLYHGSTVPRIEKIFATGALKNGAALVEDNPATSAFDLNSGAEGISWSLNGIDAMPGTRGHLAGFLAAPEDVLNGEEKMVIPSRPAPYEVLQVSEMVEPEKFYAIKQQAETWGDGSVSLGERANIDSNLMRMLMHKEGDQFFGSSVYEYSGDTSAEELRKYFQINDAGKVVWDVDMHQQGGLPPALPWFQSLIDRGILQRNNYEGLDEVEKVVAEARRDQEFLRRLLATARTEAKPVLSEYDELLSAAEAVRVPVEKMYFVASHEDLDDWIKVMARTGAMPKGILLYDDDEVMFENFANRYEGNHGELSAELGRVVGADKDFWQREMGFDPREMPRSGSVGQVLLDSRVPHDKVGRKVDGWFAIE